MGCIQTNSFGILLSFTKYQLYHISARFISKIVTFNCIQQQDSTFHTEPSTSNIIWGMRWRRWQVHVCVSMNVRLRLFVYISAQKQRLDMIKTQTQSFLGCIIFYNWKDIHFIICDTKIQNLYLLSAEIIVRNYFIHNKNLLSNYV